MAIKYTEEQLNTFDKATLIQLLLMQQSQLQEIDKKLQLLLEQAAVLKNNRFGKKSEKLGIENQVCFMEVDGDIVFFNEAEAVNALVLEDEEKSTKPKNAKTKGKRTADIKDLPVIHVDHKMTESELITEFGEDGWYQLEDEIYRRYRFTSMKIEIEEHHVGVYKSKKDNHFKKAEHPAYLLRNSLVSPTLLSGIWNAKYVNAVPLYRQEQEFQRMGVSIDRGEMAHWTILCAERYLSVFYDYLHEKMYDYHVLQADETPVLVSKENRTSGSRHYMWVYRTGKMYQDKPIVLYEYQPSRNADHPRVFLKDFQGICVTDGYQVYHTLEKEREDLRIAGCWAHARRRFDAALTALKKDFTKEQLKETVAYQAMSRIGILYKIEEMLHDKTPEEKYEERQKQSRPVMDAMFEWLHTMEDSVDRSSLIGDAILYTLNQEVYLRRYLEDGHLSIDNNSAERALKNFAVGRRNWLFAKSIRGADASALVYSITETALLNHLKPYAYLTYILDELRKMGAFPKEEELKKLLPWSENLPEYCRTKLKK